VKSFEYLGFFFILSHLEDKVSISLVTVQSGRHYCIISVIFACLIHTLCGSSRSGRLGSLGKRSECSSLTL
jgi:hypothetical protein